MSFELLFTPRASADLDSLEADAALAKRLNLKRKLETTDYTD